MNNTARNRAITKLEATTTRLITAAELVAPLATQYIRANLLEAAREYAAAIQNVSRYAA